jgi:hypothetical protein
MNLFRYVKTYERINCLAFIARASPTYDTQLHISLLTGGFSVMLTVKEMPLPVHLMRLGVHLFT